jgi:hypothetical protein
MPRWWDHRLASPLCAVQLLILLHTEKINDDDTDARSGTYHLHHAWRHLSSLARRRRGKAAALSNARKLGISFARFGSLHLGPALLVELLFLTAGAWLSLPLIKKSPARRR